MTKIVQYHPGTQDLALFESDGEFWIGAYNPNLCHQNSEPLYYFISGYWDNLQDGLDQLIELTGDEY